VIIQVLVGFLGTGYLVVAVIVVYYLFAFDPKQNPFDHEHNTKRMTKILCNVLNLLQPKGVTITDCPSCLPR
jgi:hypothetical protein